MSFRVLLIFSLCIFTLSSFGNNLFYDDHPDYPEVYQREYIVTNFSEFDMVQTYGLVTCVALSIYDKDTKSGMLAHIDSRTDLSGLLTDIKFFKNGNNSVVELHGGVRNTAINLSVKIEKFLIQQGIKIDTIKVNQNTNSSMNISLNLKNGVIKNYDETFQSTEYKVGQAKISRLKFGRKIYRHEDSLGGGDPVDFENQYDIYDF